MTVNTLWHSLRTFLVSYHNENKLLHLTLGARTSDTTTHIIDKKAILFLSLFTESNEQNNSVTVSLRPGSGKTAQHNEPHKRESINACIRGGSPCNSYLQELRKVCKKLTE